MTLTDAELDHLADLARLDLAGEEREALRDDIGRVLGYVALLQEVDVTGVAPLLRPMPLADVLREDVAGPPADGRALAALTATLVEGRLRVPRTVDPDA
jgi:aspartyl-tRNA(Asn)/glutamyl-tRNA(Gln) amidotransferase subunit C